MRRSHGDNWGGIERVCTAQQYYGTVQTPVGKTNNAPRPGGRLQRCNRAARPPSSTEHRRRALHTRRSDPANGRRADRDRAYAPEIALNGRTKALNNAAIISDGVLSIYARPARELFNILSRSGGGQNVIVNLYICVHMYMRICTKCMLPD